MRSDNQGLPLLAPGEDGGSLPRNKLKNKFLDEK